MARKKKGDSGGGYNWMDTYGDMVTLLLTFFIMLFSMSTVNEEKWAVLVRAFSRNPDAATAQIIMVAEGDGDDIAPASGVSQNLGQEATDPAEPRDLIELYEMISSFIEANDMESSVSVEKDAADNVYIRFDNSIFFDGDSSILREESFPILDFLGDCLLSVEDQIFITRVNGHTAAIPGEENYHVSDWMLSGERASQVIIYFEERKGLNPKKLMSNGYGKNYPIDTNDTPEGRAKNRRVEIMILGNDFDTANAEDLYTILTHLVSADTLLDNSASRDIIEAETGEQDDVQSVSATEEEISNHEENANGS